MVRAVGNARSLARTTRGWGLMQATATQVVEELARAQDADGGGLGRVGWLPKGELDERQWAHAGRRMSAIERASQWWIGDWLRYGSARWGEKYSQAARITGYDVPSLRNMAWVANEFDLSRRCDNLTWSHHAAAAGLEPEEQARWLDQAARLRLSVADLRSEIRTSQRGVISHKAHAGGGGLDSSPAVCPTCGQALPPEQELALCATT